MLSCRHSSIFPLSPLSPPPFPVPCYSSSGCLASDMSSPCSEGNNYCSLDAFCFTVPGGSGGTTAKCSCPTGLRLNSNNISCSSGQSIKCRPVSCVCGRLSCWNSFVAIWFTYIYYYIYIYIYIYVSIYVLYICKYIYCNYMCKYVCTIYVIIYIYIYYFFPSLD